MRKCTVWWIPRTVSDASRLKGKNFSSFVLEKIPHKILKEIWKRRKKQFKK